MSIKSVIQIIICILSVIPILGVVVGGLRYITSGGESGKVGSAKTTIVYGFVASIPLTGIALFILLFVPPIDTLSIVSLILASPIILFGICILIILLLSDVIRSLARFLAIRLRLARKRKNDEFDIILNYNEVDKNDVIQLADQLRKEGMRSWPDVREMQRRQLSSPAQIQEHREIKAAGACVGREGTGPWQRQETESLLRKFVIEGRSVIPILLPYAPQKPLLPPFLQGMIWIDLRGIKRWKDLRSGRSSSMQLLLDAIAGRGSSRLQSSPLEQGENEILAALNNRSYRRYAQLAQAIISLIEVTDPTPIDNVAFEPGTLWEIVLPSLGLQLPTSKALFFLRKEKLDLSRHEQLADLKNSREASLIFVADFLEGLESPRFTNVRSVWLRPEHLSEILRTRDIVAWLGRLIASEVEYFEGLIPYSSGGSAQLFYGRTFELEQLAGFTAQGGIIVGAHGSGKTSLLDQLNKRLKKQESNVVIDRYTYSSSFHSFFEHILHHLDLPIPDVLTAETWSSTLRTYLARERYPVLFIDEVDQLIAQDTAQGFVLGREMRALQYDGYCKFYLAGGKRLQKVIQLEGSPFRNFAQEVTLTGLEKSAALQLVQTPMQKIGYIVSGAQAERIYQGTAGVAVLIQEFCKHLLLLVRRNRSPNVTDAAIERVEHIPEYLNFVFRYYEYAQTGNTRAVMLIVAQLGQGDRQDILHAFDKYGVKLTWEQLDGYLTFLTQFDVLREFEPGRYRISSVYQSKAIEARTYKSDAFLISQLERGKKE